MFLIITTSSNKILLIFDISVGMKSVQVPSILGYYQRKHLIEQKHVIFMQRNKHIQIAIYQKKNKSRNKWSSLSKNLFCRLRCLQISKEKKEQVRFFYLNVKVQVSRWMSWQVIYENTSIDEKRFDFCQSFFLKNGAIKYG